MLKTALIVIVVAVVGLLAFAATRPNSFSVQRSAVIKAPPEKIHALINAFTNWPRWSPWEKLDPAMQRTLGGPPAGVGSSYAWSGNSQAGAGRMEITDSQAPGKVVIQLDFIKPFEGHNIAEFTLVPQGDATQVNWRMYGPSPFISKLMGVFVSMDALIGKDFEAGLANLKAVAEQP
jgi:Polyketide cyclase / dehydrase and lipid transport